MAKSETEICNAALARIGAEPISNMVNPRTTNARYCKELFPQARDYLLRKFEWDFATRRQTMAHPSITNNTSYDYIYTIPPKCMRVLDLLNGDGVHDDNIEWIIEGEYLYTNEDDAMFKFIFQVEDVRKFDPGFTNALAARLAWLLCLKVTGKINLRQTLYREYLFQVGEAEGLDGLEHQSEPKEPKRWDQAH